MEKSNPKVKIQRSFVKLQEEIEVVDLDGQIQDRFGIVDRKGG
jgi:hypothetical protein